MANWYTWTAEISVDPMWVADGFELTEERLMDMVRKTLGYAYQNEIKVKVLSAPDNARIRQEQGYAT